ncbi:MAG: phosphoenolpyruvate--protein phosphotransferase [Acidobacteria bacterium]|nr:MAG: phosphoenolpyruvate--protein phosphotransferase [Acidobacteriota bacterium]
MRREPGYRIRKTDRIGSAGRRASFKLSGIPLSPGTILGTAYQAEPFKPSFYRLGISRHEVSQEMRRFEAAVEQSRQQLTGIRKRLEALVGKDRAYIADVHLLILEDHRFRTEIERRIVDRLYSPERAIRETAQEWLSIFRSLEDPFFQERGSELQDVEDRLLANLTEVNGKTGLIPEALILVAPEVTLSVLADYELERIKGLVVTRAGTASHVTIIARSYQIPMVSGIENLIEHILTGDTILVDGDEGVVYRNPTRTETEHYHSSQSGRVKRPDAGAPDSTPGMTADGRPVYLYINTESESEVLTGLKQGAEGVGLFRSEFMFVKNRAATARARPAVPPVLSEQAQFESYRSLAVAAGSKPVMLRTLDTGEGTLPVQAQAGFEQSWLGLRGIRLSLKYPEVFRLQLRALLRASAFGNLNIMFPMVSSADEMIQGRETVQAVEAELEREGVKLERRVEVGVMVEVPAAVFTLDAILEHADFAAVGTNDLIQYTLAAGRADDLVSDLFSPLHPAVLASLKKVADACARANKKAYVCGEAASHPLYAYILIGLGFQHLSLHLHGVAYLKSAIRGMSYQAARRHANHLLKLPTFKAVNQFVQEHLESQWKGLAQA